MQLEIGKEYTEVQIKFLTKSPWKEKKVTYMGKHPYDGRHIFASETGGVMLVPENGEFFNRIS